MPPFRIRYRVAKHIEKEGLGEGVEVGQGLAALSSEGFGLVQDGGNAALLFQWGQWNWKRAKNSRADVQLRNAPCELGEFGYIAVEVVPQER